MSEEIVKTNHGNAVLRRSRRRTLAISVLPDGTLELLAPRLASIEAILVKLDKRAKWIRAQRRAFTEMRSVRPMPRYVSGATHRYLGRQYRLKVVHGPINHVVLRGGYFHTTVTQLSESHVQGVLAEWYKKRADEQLSRRIGAWEEWCRRRHLPKPKLRLRSMQRRWASASANGTIRMNPDLMHAPSICIDYVITHEICHLRHPHHGRDFYKLLSQLLPRWQELKIRLERSEL